MDDVIEWLIDGAPGPKSALDIVDRLGKMLTAAGLPIERLGVFVETLHPNVMGRAFIYERGKVTRVASLSYAVRQSADYQHSPVAWVVQHSAEWRWLPGLDDRGYEVIADLTARGCVDYLAMPLRFTNGETHVLTVSSTTGFTDEHVGTLRRLTRPLARIAEIFAMRRVAANILSTYVGASSGERVLAGRIMRGDVDIIRAAIWFSDLRGFTEMSGKMSPKEVIAVLNDVFDCQVPAIEQHGGEVLKFIGDGLLAIFPITAEHDAASRCNEALAAAKSALDALAAMNDKAGTSRRIGLALHVGDVAYGNIGGASRLDFTAIGPAVNHAARLEGIAGKTGRTTVLSAEFAAAAGGTFDKLGSFELKGISGMQEVFAL